MSSGDTFPGSPHLTYRELLRSPRVLVVIVAIVAFWLVAVLGRFLWNGYVYELAYTLWYPDGVNYSYRAFLAGGIEPEVATKWLNDMYPDRSTPIPPGTPPSLEIVNSRVMYVVLSAPFVWLFGVNGLLFAPALGLLAATLIPATMLIRRGYLLWAFVGSALLLSSTTMLRWSVANLTEGVLIGVVAMLLPFLPWTGAKLRPHALVVLSLLSIAVSLTRQSLPILVSLTVFPLFAHWLSHRKVQTAWLQATVAVSLPAIVVFVLTFPREANYLLPIAHDSGGLNGLDPLSRIIDLAVSAVRLTVIEFGQLAILDRALLLLLVLSTASLVRKPLSSLAAAWIGIAVAGTFLTAWVGASGVNFRYSMPLASISILMLAGLGGQQRKFNDHQ